MTTSFANLARTTASTSKFVYQEIFQMIRNWIFIWKMIFNFECLKCEILIIDTWNEYTKKSDGMVDLFLYRKFNVRMPIT